jgi:hypothetical protein
VEAFLSRFMQLVMERWEWEELMVTPERHVGARDDDNAAARTQVRHVEHDHWTETKASVKTTELIVLVLAVIGVFLAGIMDDSINTETTWMLITALSIGYMISRGLAKAGSHYRGDDRR